MATRGDESTRVLGGADASQPVDLVTRGVNDRSRNDQNARRFRQWPGCLAPGVPCVAFAFSRVLKKCSNPPTHHYSATVINAQAPPTHHYLGVPNEISKCTQNDSDSVLGGVFAVSVHSARSATYRNTSPGNTPSTLRRHGTRPEAAVHAREPLSASPTLVARTCQSPRLAETCFLLTCTKFSADRS